MLRANTKPRSLWDLPSAARVFLARALRKRLLCAAKTRLPCRHFDEDGSVTLRFDDAYDVTLTPNADDQAIVLHCELADAGNVDKESLQKLFKDSLLGASTGGAAFGINGALNKIVLWKRHDDNFNDCQDLGKAINAFVAQIIHWKEQLENPTLARNNVQARSDSGYAFFTMKA